MSDVAAFLRARLDEDEERARKLLVTAQRASLTLEDPKYLGRSQPGWYAWPDVEAVLARALADVDAKRRVVEHTEACRADRRRGDVHEVRYLEMWWTCVQLAKAYADHPDHPEEWKP